MGILPSTVLLQTGYQKGEDYSTNIPYVIQAQQIYYFNILYVYCKTLALYLANSMLILSLDSTYYYFQSTSYSIND